jgi:hypothetical protein
MTSTDLLAHQLDLAFDTRSWHGPNLLGSLRGVTPAEAVWRPQPGRHNINELVVHAAYWKYRICRLITATDVPAFELAGSDFFERPKAPTKAEWAADIQRLRLWHTRLRTLVQAVPAKRLDVRTGSQGFTVAEVISGAAAHDLYHAGQIRLLRRMYGDR